MFGTATFYEMFKFEPVGKYLINICGTMSCALMGADELMHHAEQRARHQGRRHHPRRPVHAPARRVPGGVHRGADAAGQLPLPVPRHHRRSTSWSTTCAPGGSRARSRRTARSPRIRQHIPADEAVGAVDPDDVASTARLDAKPAPAEAADERPQARRIPGRPGSTPATGPRSSRRASSTRTRYTLERYLATGGYDGLQPGAGEAAGRRHDEVKNATLLGRGGAGFPAGIKWGLTPPGVWPRYLVVNGDESEPGTYKDRLLMERDPHQLIEGCLIACYAAGLSQCFLYIRGEMALAQERVATALNDAYAAGYIGKNILGTDFSVDIVLHWGAGAYVVGEETALIESLEGNRGMPRLKPPYFPAAIGLYGQPTIVNNVETLANLPWLLLNGAAAYTAIGTETSPGTRMVAVSGHVERPGVFEIVNGTTTFRDLIYGDEFCQGIRDGNELKAFVPGGGSAPWFVADQLDIPFEGKLVGAAGSMLGSGAVMVMDDDHRHPGGRAHAGAVLRPRVVRQVRAVPRGRHVVVADPRADRRRRRHRRRPRPARRGRRDDLPRRLPARVERAARPRGRAVPVQDDHDLLRRSVGVRADRTRR